MNKLLLVALSFIPFACSAKIEKLSVGFIVPAPKVIKTGEGKTAISLLIMADKALANEARFLQKRLQEITDLKAKTAIVRKAEAGTSNGIILCIDSKMPRRAYKLVISKGKVFISGACPYGAFYGVQTFLWIIRKFCNSIDHKQIIVPEMSIFDYPGLKLRGLDWQWCYKNPGIKFMTDTVKIMSALKFNVIVPEFGPILRLSVSGKSDNNDTHLDTKDFRLFLKTTKEYRLQVIPKINSLSHNDRGFPWPKPLGDGLDLGEEQNYQALFEEVLAYKRELADAGISMPYFHFGMDEALNCLAANAKKYGKTAAELLAVHIERIAKFCRKNNIRMIIYHDMLIGSSEKIFWRDMGCNHADPIKSFLARTRLSKDIIINYWNYEGFDRYRTIENVKKEGFAIIFSPWAGTSVRKMAKNAALYGIGILGTTWSDSGYTKPGAKIPLRSIFSRSWLRDAIVNLAEYSWNPQNSENNITYGKNALLCWLYRHKRAIEQINEFKTISLPGTALPKEIFKKEYHKEAGLSNDTVILKGIPFNISRPTALGNLPAAKFDCFVAEKLKKATKPLDIRIKGKSVIKIKYVNKPQSFNGVTLYTRKYGYETGHDIYGTEALIQGDMVCSKNDWGIGNTRIPRNGMVISGWGEKNYPLLPLTVGSEISIYDANGKKVNIHSNAMFHSNPDHLVIRVNDKFKEIIFLHSSAMEAPLKKIKLVNGEVIYKDGKLRKFSFNYLEDIASYGEAVFSPLLGHKRYIAAINSARHNYDWTLYAYRWNNPYPRKEIKAVKLFLTKAGKEFGYILWALTGIKTGKSPI